MMSAAAMGATAFQKGLGAIHSLSHPVGALYDTHHGMTNAVFMPYVLAFNRPAIEEKIARARRLSRHRRRLRRLPATPSSRCGRRLGVPHTLKGLKVDGARRDLIGDMAIVDPTAGGNPGAADQGRGAEDFRRGDGRGMCSQRLVSPGFDLCSIRR